MHILCIVCAFLAQIPRFPRFAPPCSATSTLIADAALHSVRSRTGDQMWHRAPLRQGVLGDYASCYCHQRHTSDYMLYSRPAVTWIADQLCHQRCTRLQIIMRLVTIMTVCDRSLHQRPCANCLLSKLEQSRWSAPFARKLSTRSSPFHVQKSNACF